MKYVASLGISMRKAEVTKSLMFFFFFPTYFLANFKSTCAIKTIELKV